MGTSATSSDPAGEPFILAVTGKMGSGKDTIAPLVAAVAGAPDAAHVFFSAALNNELDTILAQFRTGRQDVSLAAELGVEPSQVAHLRRILSTEGGGRFEGSATGRTLRMRHAKQFWGTGVRRGQNPDYWVNIAMVQVLAFTAGGTSVFITDARYVNEVEALQAQGAVIVRLAPPDDVRLARLEQRDGWLPDAAAASHISETALDDWGGFDVIHDNVGPAWQVAEEIAAEAMPLWAGRTRHRLTSQFAGQAR